MMDFILEVWVCALMELARSRHRALDRARPETADRLKLLFFGYNGGRNTGADVRVHEMIRQVGHILGDDRCELSVVTLDTELTRGYFGATRQIELPELFPPFLQNEIPRHDGLIACEGSMFKSKFADALTTMMVGALGMAAANKKLSVAYGAEAGKMNFMPRWMTSRYCKDSFVIARSEESAALLNGLGVPALLGTDTAWTFEPAPLASAEQRLRDVGWDGEAPVLTICPVNPYFWPVTASLSKLALMKVFGWYKESHFSTYYFHQTGPAVERAYHAYLDAIAGGVLEFQRQHAIFPVLIAMEMVDDKACSDLRERLGGEVPIISSRQVDMFEMVAVLRRSSMMLSSRYHAIVTSMPGLVPSAGITLDERIRNLMHQRNQRELFAEVDAPDLRERVVELLRVLHGESDRIRSGIRRTVVEQLQGMGRMGMDFESHVKSHFPDFPLPSRPARWQDYLPPLCPELESLLA